MGYGGHGRCNFLILMRRAWLVVLLALAAPAAAGERPFATIGSRRIARSRPPAPGAPVAGAYTTVASQMRALAPRLNPRDRVRKVFYPAAASDLARVFDLFDGPGGGPDEIAIADVLPFGAPREIAETHAEADTRALYFAGLGHFDARGRAGVHDVDNIKAAAFANEVGIVGPALLWELEHVGARDVHIEYIDGNGDRAARAPAPMRARMPGTITPRLPQDWRPSFYDPARRQLARVTFDLGGRRRTVTYVQHDVREAEHLPPVLARFLDGGIDAYVEKAGMHLEDLPGYRDLAGRALAHLSADGVVVSDRATVPAMAAQRPGRPAPSHEPLTWGYDTLHLSAP